ncbi:MAG: nucleotide excision repair endonuclease, partial [Candidatus Eisenbacteria bacterium]|nr:nucleotide excision repair endonuclease [Candidatus Eisenbacteria bacterium]
LHDRILDLTAALRLGPPPSPPPPRAPAAPRSSSRDTTIGARRRRIPRVDVLSASVEDPSLASDESSLLRERLHQCRLALERLLAARGDQPLSWIQDEIEASTANVPVDLSRCRFDRETLADLPQRPGIYRFRGENDRLLYVGKSRDLRRRVMSYFRPLGRDHARRAALLEEIRSLDWETAPSELEALLLESESIRREMPPFNKQVEVHPGGPLPARRDTTLGFVLCEGDLREVSVFLFREGRGWARTRLPRGAGEQPGTRARASQIVDLWRAGETGEQTDLPSSQRPLHGLEPPESELVTRYARVYRSRLDSVILDEFKKDADLAKALARLARRERPAWEPWDVRAGLDRRR